MTVNVHKGTNYRVVGFPDFPVKVLVEKGQGDDRTFRRAYKGIGIDPFTIYAVDFFFGHDRGDIFEMDVTVYAKGDRFVARRIEENESPQHREASKLVTLPMPIETDVIEVFTLCRVTGQSRIDNSEHESYKRWRGVFDLNIILIGTS